jgi:zinc protease
MTLPFLPDALCRAIIALLAGCGGMVRAIEVEGLPEPAEPRPVKLAIPVEKTLPNGLRVLVVERPGLPLISAMLVIKSGAEADSPQAAGLASFVAALLTKGTAMRSATEIAGEVEALGATLKAEATWDATITSLTTLSANSDPAFALLADVVRHPKFAPAEIERLRRQTLDDLRLSFEEPGTLAKLGAARAILGTSPYAHAAAGIPASVAHLTRGEIANFHSRHFTPGHALLVIAGNITTDAGFALAEKVFGDWKSTGPREATGTKPTAPPKPRATLIDMPNAGQAAVVLGAPGITRKAEDYFAGEVANAVLGGGYTSRLNQEIRIKRGLSYGARSTLDAMRGGGLFTARAQTKNASAAEVAQVMLAECARLGSEDVSADYLATRQAVLTGEYAREFETNESCVKRIADFALHDLPLEILNQYADRIRAVSVTDVRAFAAKHFTPEAMSIVVAGNAKECAKPLREAFPKLEVIPQSALDLDSPALRKTTRR